MKINKEFLIGMVLTLLIPVCGLLYTLVKTNKKNYNSMVFNLFLFVYLITLNLHPYQDLYRRYIETYYFYNERTTYIQAIIGHVDFSFYVLALTAKKINLPFPFLVSLLSASSVVLFLKSILSGVRSETKNGLIRSVLIVGLLSYPTIQLALGIRWGFAISIMLYGYFCLFSKGRYLSGGVVIILSILTHFSMLIFLPVLASSFLLKLNRFSFVTLSVSAYIISTLFLMIILSNLGGIGAYASDGYGADNDVNGVGNLNSIIATGFGFICTAFFTMFLLVTWKGSTDEYFIKVRNVTLMLFVFSCFSAVSFVAFRRYTNTFYYLFVLCTCLHYFQLKNKIKNVVIILSIISFLFSGLYLQRRPLLLGEAWKGLYTPAIMYVLLDTPTYNRYLSDIDEDGDWKSNKISK